MPAIDHFQPVVVHALQKAGWQVDNRPYRLRVDNRYLYIDLKAQREVADATTEVIVLEVKGFTRESLVENLEGAVGQYVLYRALLEEFGLNFPLYLAIPAFAFRSAFGERLGQIIQRRLHVKMLVVNEENEEILEWID